MIRKLVSFLLGATLVAGAVGCSNSNSGSGSNGGGTSTVDLAVMDRDYNNDTDYQVMLWLDVLSNSGPGLPPPDMVFDPGTQTPVDAKFYNGDLYVAATDNATGGTGGVLIWRDYLSHVDGDGPDVVLFDATMATNPDDAQRLALENNVLVSATWYDSPGTGGAYVYGDAANLTSSSVADAVLNQATVGAAVGTFDYPTEPVLANGRLFLGIYDSTVGTDACVAIWSNVQDLVANGASAPDAILTDSGNMLGLGQSCKHLTVANNILYVGGESDPNFNAPFIFVFNSADTVDNSSLPDNVLIGCSDSTGGNTSDNHCYIESPGRLTVDSNGILWVANKNENISPNDNPAVSGFFPAASLFENQPPAVMIDKTSGPAQAERVASVGGALFVTGSPENDNGWVRKGIYVYTDPVNGAQPTLSAMGDDDTTLAFMRFPTGLAATVRGTFDNFVDNGT